MCPGSRSLQSTGSEVCILAGTAMDLRYLKRDHFNV